MRSTLKLNIIVLFIQQIANGKNHQMEFAMVKKISFLFQSQNVLTFEYQIKRR